MNYEVTYFWGERDNESTIYVHNVKRIFYDNETVVFFGEETEPLFVMRQPKYRIVRIPEQ